MRQSNINEAAQRQRRKDARFSAFLSSLMLLLSGLVMLLLRRLYCPDGFWGAVMLIFSLLDLGMIFPIWILLKKRLKEIEGGEEDAAAQY